MRFLLFALLLIPAFAQDDIKEYYGKTPGPRAQLTADEGIDKSVYAQLNIRAILAIVKFELAKGTWSELARDDRDKLLSIVNDPSLTFIYTGKQSLLAHSSGGQTIDKNTIKIHQDGLYMTGAPRPSYRLGQIFLHEMGHVYQERYNWTPRPGRTKEWFPESLEKQLSSAKFNPATIALVDQLLKCPDISGTWKGTLKVISVHGTKVEAGPSRPAVLDIEQTGCEVTMKFGGNTIKGTADYETAKFNRESQGTVVDATLKFYSPGTATANIEVVQLTQRGPNGDVVSQSVGNFKSR